MATKRKLGKQKAEFGDHRRNHGEKAENLKHGNQKLKTAGLIQSLALPPGGTLNAAAAQKNQAGPGDRPDWRKRNWQRCTVQQLCRAVLTQNSDSARPKGEKQQCTGKHSRGFGNGGHAVNLHDEIIVIVVGTIFKAEHVVCSV
jgi:hypothetical protein